MKKSFSLLEIIFVLFLLSITYVFINLQLDKNLLTQASNKLLLYLKQTRYIALIDDKHDNEDPLWHKKRWTLKFLKCKSSVGGLYYVIYSDTNKKGQPNLEESLLDPLSNKYIYSSNSCELRANRSKYVLLTKEYDIENIDVSCNSTSSLGQLSFSSKGELYSKLSRHDYDSDTFRVDRTCKITLFSKNGENSVIYIDENTGYSYKK